MNFRSLSTAALSIVLLLAVACGGSDSKPASSSSGASAASASPSAPAFSGKVTVFAAASLTDAFKQIGTDFQAKNPGVTVEFNFAGSPTLRTQLEQGARADVYASADTTQMNLARDHSVVGDAGRVFARNSLVIITPSDNPGKLNSPADLGRSGLKLVLANADVPVGAYARQMLASMEKDASFGAGFSATVLKNVVSLESDVKQVVAKVQLGEADAGVVYGTDVTPAVAPKLKTIAVPTQFNVVAEYPITSTKDASNPAAAKAFIDYVLSQPGQAVLKQYGFQSAGS